MKHIPKRPVKVQGLVAIDCRCGWVGRGGLLENAVEEYERHANGEVMDWEEEWNNLLKKWEAHRNEA
jgi:hypothetical protein